MKLPTLAEVDATRPRAQPKKKSRLEEKVIKRKAARGNERAFIAAVWARDKGRCRACSIHVVKTLELVPERGEVHHRRGRNVAPEDRYAVAQAVLLCLQCHQKIQWHEIEAPK